jgi:hypothetical protein
LPLPCAPGAEIYLQLLKSPCFNGTNRTNIEY